MLYGLKVHKGGTFAFLAKVLFSRMEGFTKSNFSNEKWQLFKIVFTCPKNLP